MVGAILARAPHDTANKWTDSSVSTQTSGLSTLPAVFVCAAEWRSIKGGVSHLLLAKELWQKEQEVVPVVVAAFLHGMCCMEIQPACTHTHTHTNSLPVLLSDALSLDHKGQLGDSEQCADSTTRIVLGAKICRQICFWLTTTSTCFQLWNWNISEKIDKDRICFQFYFPDISYIHLCKAPVSSTSAFFILARKVAIGCPKSREVIKWRHHRIQTICTWSRWRM